MNFATLPQHLVSWSLSAAALTTVIFLNAWVEREHSETETAAITAQIDNDRMQEHAAINNQPIALVAPKE